MAQYTLDFFNGLIKGFYIAIIVLQALKWRDYFIVVLWWPQFDEFLPFRC